MTNFRDRPRYTGKIGVEFSCYEWQDRDPISAKRYTMTDAVSKLERLQEHLKGACQAFIQGEKDRGAEMVLLTNDVRLTEIAYTREVL